MDFATAYRNAGGNRLRNDIRTAAFAFQGGINIMDSPAQVVPGSLLGCLNYEPGVRGGYRRFDGFERFDGHSSPSNSPFLSINVPAGYQPPVGTLITESGSGATGEVCYVDTTNHFIVLTNITGTFTVLGATLNSSYGNANSIGPGYLNGALTDALASTYYLAKFNYLQGSIGPVGGSSSEGEVLGVFPYLDHVYAFRNDVGGTSASMWKSTTTGWVKVNLGIKVRFTNGIYSASMQAPAEGTTVTGATSGATMTIKRITSTSGTWGTDAAGYFIVASITGTPTPGELFKVGTTTYFTYQSHAAQSLPPGGVYEFRLHNFNAVEDVSTGFRMYGVNGVGNGFEYDATSDVFVAIETGMSPDVPTHLEVHADYLFYSFAGGSLQNSGYQKPLLWLPVFGADARSVGEDVTFLREDVSQTLVIGTRRRVWNLTGISSELFQIKVYAPNTGAVARTDELPGQIMFLEDRGFTNAQATPAYGNFASSSLSDKILDLVTRLLAGDTPVGAVVTRKKNLYRVCFASGTVLCLGINANGSIGGWTQGSFGIKISGFYGGFSQSVTGGPQVERAFICGTNGYVYEIDTGRSFDGQNVLHFLRMSYFNARTPDMFKRWRRMQVDLEPEGLCTLSISVDYDYGNRSGQADELLDFSGNGGFWDIATWDQFTWDAAQYSQAVIKVEGEGYNIGMFFAGNSNNDAPVTLYGASLQYSPRVINRNTKD